MLGTQLISKRLLVSGQRGLLVADLSRQSLQRGRCLSALRAQLLDFATRVRNGLFSGF